MPADSNVIDRNVTDRGIAAQGGADPWQQTLGLLAARPASRALPCAPAVPRAARGYYGALISVIDRPGPGTATLAWRDATHCRYGDQEWCAGTARAAGVCAMSGQAIAAGDAIYKPRACRPRPRNADAMILATVLDAAAD
ncbi:DUF3331 domain-containing protein [Cupriavidus sp. 30B13]|uniref:DUF3331 domain-containing protein n=1 Tax=Cupriavidus sp. 30B13 TaxID=3384241 RepID=UPI003B910CFF